MDGSLVDLAVSVVLIAVTAWGLAHGIRLDAGWAAALAALLVVGCYLPFMLPHWHGGAVVALHLASWLLAACVCGIALHRREQYRTGRLHWIPAAIVGFFVALLALNVFFIVLAEQGLAPSLSVYLLPAVPGKGPVSSGFPGVISHDFQQKETLYNAYLQQVQQQQARGWQIQKGWLGRPVMDQLTVFKVVARTRESDPLTGATVEGQFLRPADSRLDRTFSLPEGEPGVYQAPLSLPAAGLWDLVLVVRRGEERHEIRASTEVGSR